MKKMFPAAADFTANASSATGCSLRTGSWSSSGRAKSKSGEKEM
jgi:hypothetical protein